MEGDERNNGEVVEDPEGIGGVEGAGGEDNEREEIESNEEGNGEAREEIDCASSPEEENPDTSHDEHRQEVSSLRRHIDSGLDQLSSLYKKLQR